MNGTPQQILMGFALAAAVFTVTIIAAHHHYGMILEIMTNV